MILYLQLQNQKKNELKKSLKQYKGGNRSTEWVRGGKSAVTLDMIGKRKTKTKTVVTFEKVNEDQSETDASREF